MKEVAIIGVGQTSFVRDMKGPFENWLSTPSEKP